LCLLRAAGSGLRTVDKSGGFFYFLLNSGLRQSLPLSAAIFEVTIMADTTFTAELTRARLQSLFLRAAALAPDAGKTLMPLEGFFIARRPPCEQLCAGHEHPTVFLQLSGVRTYIGAGTTVRCVRGDMVRLLFEQTSVFRIEAAEDAPEMITLGLTISEERLRRVAAAMPAAPASGSRQLPASAAPVSTEPADGRWLDHFSELLTLCESPERLAVLGDALLDVVHYELLAGSWGESLRALVCEPDSLLGQVAHGISLITRNATRDEPVERVAAAAGLTASRFTRAVRELLGQTPLQYRKDARLALARNLITETKLTNEQIAQRLGYTSTSQFVQEYRRKFGVAPRSTVVCL